MKYWRGLLILILARLKFYSPIKTTFRHKAKLFVSSIIVSGGITTNSIDAFATTNQNFLTNSVLDKVIKIDQVDLDDSDAKANKVILLVPIVSISQDFTHIGNVLESQFVSSEDAAKLYRILMDSKYSTSAFKKLFNRYSDNIFYTDTDRANLYLAGGAIPTSRQTQQYLLRNDILTSIENLREDLMLMTSQVIDRQDIDDAVSDLNSAINSLSDYLSLADPNDVERAKDILKSSS